MGERCCKFLPNAITCRANIIEIIAYKVPTEIFHTSSHILLHTKCRIKLLFILRYINKFSLLLTSLKIKDNSSHNKD